MLPVIFLGVKIMFGSFCSIASPFLDVLEGMLEEEVQENDSDEGESLESGNEEEMDTGEEDMINYRKCISGDDFGADDSEEESQEQPQGKGEEDGDNDDSADLFSDEEDWVDFP